VKLLDIAPLALVVAACGGAATSTQPTQPARTAAPAFQPTAFVVDVKGHGKPVILVPGLACPGTVWDDTVAHWAGKYETHVLTLAGFAGRPPLPGDAKLAATTADEIVRYIEDRKLDHPIIVGHSMGGFIAYWVAAKAPGLVGPVVAVDGAPAFPGDPAENAKNASAFREQFVAASDADFAEQTRAIFGSMAAHPDRLERYVPDVLRSDRRAFANAFHELMTTDLRPELPKITASVLVVIADTPFSKGIAEMDQPIPHHRVETIAGTKHFVMIDDPDAFYRVVDAFLAAP
jgi:N-formylmaleamate deformylase